jgi:hypothetical protein
VNVASDSIMGAVVSVVGAATGALAGTALTGADDVSQTVTMAGAGGALGYVVHRVGLAAVGWIEGDAAMRRAMAALAESLTRRLDKLEGFKDE